ncbi:electron transfer flavoprotein subunit alpha/FixB family protein [Candidatus Bathyarchaeota archaeon]|nr:electron transfer flavoprotein subunit alpha/FixB family protein [Candidatus Bathyarchaeota archaeon]
MTASEKHEGVWVFSEAPNVARELLSKGRDLSGKLGTHLAAVSIGEDVSETSKDLIAFGADKVYTAQDASLKTFQVHPYSEALTDMVQTYKPDVVLIGATRSGLELAARLAERLKTGCCTECSKLDIDIEKKCVVVDRLILGGNITETLTVRSKPQIFTLPKGVFQPLGKDPSRTGEIVKVQPKLTESPVKVLDRKPKQFAGVRITDAEAIVSFGRGLKNKEDIPVVEGLAKTINGVVGCSRPIAEDLKWLPVDQYVGLSGQKVAPKLYIACGISGQIQHITGIQNARVVVAVNTDSKAPIFEYSDYGIVGDLYKIVPAIVEAYRKLSSK